MPTATEPNYELYTLRQGASTPEMQSQQALIERGNLDQHVYQRQRKRTKMRKLSSKVLLQDQPSY